MRIPVGGQLRQMAAEKLRCEGDDRLMSQFGLNFLDLDGPSPAPCDLRNSGRPERSGFGGQTLVLHC